MRAFNQPAPETNAATPAPVGTAATTFLRFAGVTLAIFGVIAGFIILSNAPDAPGRVASPLYGDTSPSQIQSAARTLYLVMGWAQIVGGLTVGILLYTVAGIGEAVRDLWTARQGRSE